MTPASRLREVREYLCLRAQDVVALTGIASARLEAIEEDREPADEFELQRLARAYGHPVSYFTSGSSAETSPLGRARLLGDLTEHDQAELERFTAFLRDTTPSG